ncbi:MAG: hypothetical protein ACFFCZ_16790 [Promethearchaeota archaeon]
MIRSRLTILFLIASFVVLLVSYLLIPSVLGTDFILTFNVMKIVLFFLYLIAVYLAFTERSGKTMKVSSVGNLWPFRIGGGFASARTWCFMLGILNLAIFIIVYLYANAGSDLTTLFQLLQQDIANILLVVLSMIIAFIGGLVYEDEKVKRVI